MWFEFFRRFWNHIREVYGEDIWEKKEGNKLLVNANLWALQEALLREADGQRPRVWQVDSQVTDLDRRLELLDEALKDLITATLEYIPKDMWQIAWKNQSQDTTAGRTTVQTFLTDELIGPGKKTESVRRNWKKLDWFKVRKSKTPTGDDSTIEATEAQEQEASSVEPE